MKRLNGPADIMPTGGGSSIPETIIEESTEDIMEYVAPIVTKPPINLKPIPPELSPAQEEDLPPGFDPFYDLVPVYEKPVTQPVFVPEPEPIIESIQVIEPPINLKPIPPELSPADEADLPINFDPYYDPYYESVTASKPEPEVYEEIVIPVTQPPTGLKPIPPELTPAQQEDLPPGFDPLYDLEPVYEKQPAIKPILAPTLVEPVIEITAEEKQPFTKPFVEPEIVEPVYEEQAPIYSSSDDTAPSMIMTDEMQEWIDTYIPYTEPIPIEKMYPGVFDAQMVEETQTASPKKAPDLLLPALGLLYYVFG